MICLTCKVDKEIKDFPKYKKGRGYQGVCKKCKAEWMREDRLKNPERYREIDLRQNYGIGFQEYNALLDKQNGVCAICGEKEKTKNKHLHVDHNHNTGEIRGLLCSGCNTGLGKFYDKISSLKKAISYLEGGDAR